MKYLKIFTVILAFLFALPQVFSQPVKSTGFVYFEGVPNRPVNLTKKEAEIAYTPLTKTLYTWDRVTSTWTAFANSTTTNWDSLLVLSGELLLTGNDDTLSISTLDIAPVQSLTAGNGIQVVGYPAGAKTIKMAQNGATTGQVLKWDGSNWTPAAETGVNVGAGNGITITGTPPNILVNVTNTSVTPATYPSDNISVPHFTVNARGQITSVVNTAIQFPDPDSTNEKQALSIVGQELTLSKGGGTVTIPLASEASKYSAGNGAIVMASGPGVTFSKSAGVGTFSVPTGVFIFSARVNGMSSDLDGSGHFSIVIPTTESDDFPTITKINRITGGTPSGGAPYVYDIDNSPLIQITGSTSTTVTAKVINLNAFSNWALKIQM